MTVLSSPPTWTYNSDSESKSIRPDNYVCINGERFFAELRPNKPANGIPDKTLPVDLYNIDTGVIERDMIVAIVDLKPLEEFGALARILYA